MSYKLFGTWYKLIHLSFSLWLLSPFPPIKLITSINLLFSGTLISQLFHFICEQISCLEYSDSRDYGGNLAFADKLDHLVIASISNENCRNSSPRLVKVARFVLEALFRWREIKVLLWNTWNSTYRIFYIFYEEGSDHFWECDIELTKIKICWMNQSVPL